MKPRIRRIINEAKIQRTIDSKIWASMSSMSSRLRSTLAADAKPMKRDTYDVLLQKYVAGLLTMKVDCPNTVADITKNKAYQNIGNAFIEQGGTIQEIQKLYKENGGVINTSAVSEPEQDYPEYDEVDVNDNIEDIPSDDMLSDTSDDLFDMEDDEDIDDIESKHNFDNSIEVAKAQKQELDDTDKQFPEYDNVDTEDKEDFSESIEDESDMTEYLKTLSFKFTKPNNYLIWDKSEGFKISSNDFNSIGKCVASYTNFVDNKPRFLVFTSDEEIALGNAGNNAVYDDYYFKSDNKGFGSRIQAKPGSNYYRGEEQNGIFYTNILADNENNPAKFVKNFNITDIVNFDGVTPEQRNDIISYFKEKMYLPTLPELTKLIRILPAGKYWSSSIVQNGTTNLILQVQPDKIIRTSNQQDKAKVLILVKI